MPRIALGALAAALFPLATAAQSTTYTALTYATVTVNGASFDLKLELIVPTGPGPFPVAVWVHGGGWVGGSRLPVPATATRLVPRGYAVASIDYRLSGQAIWPAQIHDCKAAIRWLRGNAATYGLDGNRIAVMGSSAGGHLVAALGTMGGVGSLASGGYVVDLEGSVGAHLGMSSRVQAVVDQFGPTAMLQASDYPGMDHDAAASAESQLIGGAIQALPHVWATVDPITFVSPDDAPLLAMHGTEDTVVPFPNSELLVQAVRAHGLEATLFPVAGNGHGGPGFLAPEATAAIDAFLDRTLRDLPDVVVSVVASDAVASENGDPAVFTLARTGSTAAALTVRLWAAGDATAGVDGALLPLLATIPAGQASVDVPFSPFDDDLVEGDEAVVLQIAPRDHYRIAHAAAAATVVLADDDSAVGLPTVSMQQVDAAATELPGNPGSVRFVRTGPTTDALVVAYDVVGTAEPGVDCNAFSGTATIPAGNVAVLAVATALQDTRREPGEALVVRLRPAANYVRGAVRSAHVVFTDDERASPLPVVGVQATDPGVGEAGDLGEITLTRTGTTTAPLVVQLAIGGTATNGVDFVALGTSAVIPAGQRWVRLLVTAIDDALVEGAESLTVRVLPSAAYVVATSDARELWLVDDEAPTPATSDVVLAMGPLGIGRTGNATIAGVSPGGIASLWIGLAPGYLPLAPFGTVGLDVLQAGEYVAGAADAAGVATLPVVVPATPALAGIATWWQAIATVVNAPFLRLSDAEARSLLGAERY